MNTRDYFQVYRERLSAIYDRREAEQIAHLIFEHFAGMTRTGRILQKDKALEGPVKEQLDHALRELLQHKPVQYVTGEAWFCGLRFSVNGKVLIPRPETEELVEWALKSVSSAQSAVSNILDIGTGSGCIAVALKKQLPACRVSALDISEDALAVARENARINGTDIDFITADILDSRQTESLPRFDIIVSNPPYIRLSEKETMHRNVTEYEPEAALFVADNDPLIFYRAITLLAREKLTARGQLFFEINESLGKEVAELLTRDGFSLVEIRNDLQGKQRMVRGVCR